MYAMYSFTSPVFISPSFNLTIASVSLLSKVVKSSLTFSLPLIDSSPFSNVEITVMKSDLKAHGFSPKTNSLIKSQVKLIKAVFFVSSICLDNEYDKSLKDMKPSEIIAAKTLRFNLRSSAELNNHVFTYLTTTVEASHKLAIKNKKVSMKIGDGSATLNRVLMAI